jgi:hypothetical protein
MKKDTVDRRKEQRFKVKEGAYAVLKPYTSKLGQIIDISKNGLSFQYVLNSEQALNASHVDILLPDSGFFLDNLQFKPVLESKISKDFSFSTLTVMRYSLEFENLTTDKRNSLEYFIQNHTMGPA